MSNEMIMLLMGFVGSLIVIVTPILKLNSNITKLTMAIENINSTLNEYKKQIAVHSEKLNNHEIRIDRLEHMREG